MTGETMSSDFDLERALGVAIEQGRTFGADVHFGYAAALYVLRGRRATEVELRQAAAATAESSAMLITSEALSRGASQPEADHVGLAFMHAVQSALVAPAQCH